MSYFEPRQVNPGHIKSWLKNGLELSARKFSAMLLITLSFMGLNWLPEALSALNIFMLPFLLAGGCIVAEAANNSESVINSLMKKPMVVWARLLVVGILPWILFIIFSLVMMFINQEPIASSATIFDRPIEPQQFDFAASTFAVLFIWFITYGYFIWFMVPLLVIAELPLLIALDQTFNALDLNKFMFWFIAVAALSTLIGVVTPVLVFPWVAIVSGAQYVSYLDIWLGIAKIKEKHPSLIKRLNQTNHIQA